MHASKVPSAGAHESHHQVQDRVGLCCSSPVLDPRPPSTVHRDRPCAVLPLLHPSLRHRDRRCDRQARPLQYHGRHHTAAPLPRPALVPLTPRAVVQAICPGPLSIQPSPASTSCALDTIPSRCHQVVNYSLFTSALPRPRYRRPRLPETRAVTALYRCNRLRLASTLVFHGTHPARFAIRHHPGARIGNLASSSSVARCSANVLQPAARPLPLAL